jgi:type IV secretion system protein VirD4
MEQFFGQVWLLAADYWWLIAAALILAEFVKPNNAVEAAIDEFKPENTHGGAKFAENKDLRKAGLFKGKGIPIGYSPDGSHELHYSGSGHLLTCASARSGKGTTLIVNALLSWPGSVFVIDPKAENAATTGHHRRKNGDVFLLKPLEIAQAEDALKGLKHARYNPMCILDPKSKSFHVLCDKIAAAIVVGEGREGKYFSDTARIPVSGVMAALARHADPSRRNLVEVARIISSGEGFFRFCREAMQSNDPFIIQKLERFALAEGTEPTREMNDVIATAISNMSFLANEAMAHSLSGSDFRFADLKRRPGTTIYVSLPLSLLDVTDRYYRLITECFLAELLDEKQRGKRRPVLAIIDEMASVGEHMRSLENAQGMISGAAGLIIWGVVQSIVQLQGMFPKTWQVFVQNAGVFMAFASRSESDREFVSKLAGTCEVVTRSRNANLDRQTGEVVVSESGSQFGRPLLHPHEVGALAKDEMLVFGVEGVNGPIRAKRKPYWKVGKFAGKFRKNPYVNSNGGGLFGRLFG